MNRKYTNEQIEWIKQNYPLYSRKETIELFNEKFNMNLSMSTFEGIRRHYHILCGRSGKFKKGQIPPNKGRPITEWMSEEGIKNSSKTRFKKEDPSFNNSNHNEVPIGTESVTKDGYILVKLDRPYPHSINKSHPNWVLKQVYVYEQAYGTIPKGHKLVFLDGNRQNCELSNLQLVSNDVHLRMNHNRYYNHSKEITRAGIEIFQAEKLIKEAGS